MRNGCIRGLNERKGIQSENGGQGVFGKVVDVEDKVKWRESFRWDEK